MKIDPRLGAPLTLAGAGLFLFAVIIGTSMAGDNANDQAAARLQMINVAVGVMIILAGRLRPPAVALGLGLMVLGQALIILSLTGRELGHPAVVIAVNVVLAVPLLVGAIIAAVIARADYLRR